MQIIVVIEQLAGEGDQKQLVGETEIDLDELQDKRLKYYPLGDKDKILQAEVYDARKRRKPEEAEKHAENQSSTEHREKFIRERRKFLENIVETETKLKKNFSEKIMELLGDSKSARNEREKMLEEPHTPQQRNLIYENGLEDYNEAKLKKSRSDHALNLMEGRPFYTVNYDRRERQESRDKVHPSQKHKLMLNTLNLVETEHPSKYLFKDRF